MQRKAPPDLCSCAGCSADGTVSFVDNDGGDATSEFGILPKGQGESHLRG